MRIDRVLDIETENWDSFVLGGLFDVTTGEYWDFWWEEEEQLVETILSQPSATTWTWYGGRYDLLWLIEECRKLGVKGAISSAGPRVTRLALPDGVCLRDGFALAGPGFSLERAAGLIPKRKLREILGGTKLKDTGLRCRCGNACGGYCRIRRQGMSGPERRALRAYLERDCRLTAAALQALFAEAERVGYKLAGTLGATAWKTAHGEDFGIPAAEWEDGSEYRLAKAADFGGRCIVVRPKAASGHRYDIHSAYPGALSKIPLPIGERKLYDGGAATRAFNRGKEGIYMARVKVPEQMFLPPLPVHVGERTAYPVGRFGGSWCGNELRYAQSLGVEIERMDLALVWSDAAPVMRDFVERCWRARDDYDEDSAFRLYHKNVPNSATGKFSERPDRDRLILNPEPTEIQACPADYDCGYDADDPNCSNSWRCCEHRCTGHCGRWKAVGTIGCLWAAPTWRLSDCSHVHWGGYLRAATRIEQHRQMISDGRGGETAVYGDTDSCYAITRRRHNLGSGLGQWGYEGPFTQWIALAPKLYRYWDPTRRRWVVRAKGIPAPDFEKFDILRRGDAVEIDRGVRALRSAARGDKLFARNYLTRKLSFDRPGWYGDRRLHGDVTIAATVTEIREGK